MTWTESLQATDESIRGTFGVPVTYTPSGGSSVEITAVFDKNPTEVQIMGAGGTGLDLQYVHPLLNVVLSDLAATPAKGDTCLIDGLIWKVIEVVLWPTSASLHLKR